MTRLLQLFEELASQPRTQHGPGFDIVLYSADLYWDRAVHEMLRQLARVEKTLQKRLLACRMDLCDEDTLRAAKLLLLPTPGDNSLLRGFQALQRQIPLLVNESAPELQELCRESNAGLAYSDADELRECLELLLTDETLRMAMGANGHKFIGAQA